MNRLRGFHFLLCFVLLSVVLGGLLGGQVVFAAQESSNRSFLLPPGQEEPPPEEPTEEKLELFAQYPILQNTPDSIFEFEVTFNHQSSERRTFDINLTSPPGWAGLIMGGYQDIQISAFEPEPGKERQYVRVIVGPLAGNLPEPGEYVFTFEASSGNIKDTIELKTVVAYAPPEYMLSLFNSTFRREIQVKAGEDNHMSILVANSLTADLENVVFSSQKPEGWSITFTPSNIESLEAGVTQEVAVEINPPRDTEAGDYSVHLKATSENADADLALRVTVQTTTPWGGVGIGIAVAIIVGLAFWFRQSGRRGATETAGFGARFRQAGKQTVSWFRRAGRGG